MSMYDSEPISQLPLITSLNFLDAIPIVDTSDTTESPSGTTKKVELQQLANFLLTFNPWITATSSPVQLVPYQGYFADGSVRILFNLPLTANVGDEFYIEGLGPNLFNITQNAGQQIIFGDKQTSVGTGGYILSTNPGDGLLIMCIVANTTFKVRNFIGTLQTI